MWGRWERQRGASPGKNGPVSGLVAPGHDMLFEQWCRSKVCKESKEAH